MVTSLIGQMVFGLTVSRHLKICFFLRGWWFKYGCGQKKNIKIVYKGFVLVVQKN